MKHKQIYQQTGVLFALMALCLGLAIAASCEKMNKKNSTTQKKSPTNAYQISLESAIRNQSLSQ